MATDQQFTVRTLDGKKKSVTLYDGLSMVTAKEASWQPSLVEQMGARDASSDAGGETDGDAAPSIDGAAAARRKAPRKQRSRGSRKKPTT